MKLNNKFIIIIPVWNAENLIKQTITSVLKQEFHNVGIIIRDDLSTDNTPGRISELIGIDGNLQKYTRLFGKDIIYIRNKQKLYGGGNTYDSVINFVSDRQSIIGVVDGDDYLTANDALSKVYQIYRDQDMWQVWTQHIAESRKNLSETGYSGYLPEDEIIYSNRHYWSVSHFRTFKAWLFNYLTIDDLLDPYHPSSYCHFAGDAAFIYPLTELCGNKKCYFLNEPLYHYNDELPTNDITKSQADVIRYSNYIRNKTIYPQIPVKAQGMS